MHYLPEKSCLNSLVEAIKARLMTVLISKKKWGNLFRREIKVTLKMCPYIKHGGETLYHVLIFNQFSV